MYTYQRKSEQIKNKNLLNSTLLPMQLKKMQNENTEETSKVNPYLFENRVKLREKLRQREEQSNYSGIPDSLKTQAEENSKLSMEDVREMHNAAIPAQLQALKMAKSWNNFINSRQDKHMENELGDVIQQKENKTGLPDSLKTGVESLSGISMNDVRVHYNSDKPKHLGALAYTQGTEIHVGPGQEQHLRHELGHVVQQKQGRVRPTTKVNGVDINDDTNLEREADTFQFKEYSDMNSSSKVLRKPIQRKITVMNEFGGADKNWSNTNKLAINQLSEEQRNRIDAWKKDKTERTYDSFQKLVDDIIENDQQKLQEKEDLMVRQVLRENRANIRQALKNFNDTDKVSIRSKLETIIRSDGKLDQKYLSMVKDISGMQEETKNLFIKKISNKLDENVIKFQINNPNAIMLEAGDSRMNKYSTTEIQMINRAKSDDRSTILTYEGCDSITHSSCSETTAFVGHVKSECFLIALGKHKDNTSYKLTWVARESGSFTGTSVSLIQAKK